MASELPDARHPLVITGGLDGAVVQILVTHPRRVRTGAQSLLGVCSMLSILVFPLWVGVLGVVVGMAWRLYETVEPVPQVLEFTVDRAGVRQHGQPVRLWFDYQRLTIQDQMYLIEGGLSRKEYQRLRDLIQPLEMGQADEVPAALRRLTDKE